MLRRGSISDILLISAFIVAVALGVVVGKTFLNEFDAANTQIDQQYMDEAQNAIGLLDQGVVFVAITMYMLSLVLAFRIPSSPIFFVPSLMLLLLSLWVTATFSNMFWEVVNVGGPVTTAANELPLIATFVQNFVFIQAGVGFLLMVVMFTRIGRSNSAGVGR